MDDKEKKLVSRLVATIVLLSIVILLLLLCFIFFQSRNSYGGCGTVNEPTIVGDPFYCGNAPILDSGMTMTNFTKGKALFKQNCAVCHTKTDQRLTGPGLKGVFDRIPNDSEWLRGFIRNADSVIASGDPYARKLYEENDSAAMTMFAKTLSDQDVEDVICYLKSQ